MNNLGVNVAVSFNLKYEGEALENHSINVRDLAPMLLSVGETFEALNYLFNGKQTTIGVNVRATSPGSYSILFDIYQQVVNNPLTEFATAILTSTSITAALNLFQILFGGVGKGVVGSLFGLIKSTKGKPIIKTEELSPGLFRISTNENTYDVPVELLKSYQSLTVRKALDGFVRQPLEKEGISSLHVSQNGQEILKINKEQSVYFKSPDINEEVLTNNTIVCAYTIRDLSFKEDGKWSLLDGNNLIKAHIEDEDFINRVNNDEIKFAKSDILLCRVNIIQTKTSKGLKTKYTVEKVIKHISSPKALSLPGFEK